MEQELGRFGVRTRPISNVPLQEQVLCLGLGQVGFWAVTQLHETLKQAIPPRTQQEYLRLLAICERQGIRQEQVLPRALRVLLSQDILPWSDIPGRFATQGVAKWWPRTPNNPALQKDPTPSRAFGRLLLWNNAELVGDSLHNITEWLRLASERQGIPRRIFILASIAEPEGSAMLHDVVGRLRLLLAHHPTQIVGVFTTEVISETPLDDDQRYRNLAHSYATLKELDAASLTPQNYAHDLPVIGQAHPSTRQQTIPHFDHICLTSTPNRPTTPNPALPLVEFVTTWILNLANQHNQTPLLPQIEKLIDNLDRYRGYTVFGVAQVTLPIRTVLDFHAINGAQQVLKNLVLEYDTSPEDISLRMLVQTKRAFLSHRDFAKHPLLVDFVREWQRQLSAPMLKKTLNRQQPNWVDVVSALWQKLSDQNIVYEENQQGDQVPRRVIRRQIDEVLGESFRKLTLEIEHQAIELAFIKGYGLRWAYLVFEAYVQQIKKAIEDLQKSQPQVHARRWISAAESRDLNAVETIGTQVFGAFLARMAWEARLVVWQKALKHATEILQRIDLAIQQIPVEQKRLEERKRELSQFLDQANHPQTAVVDGVLFNDAWVRQGMQQVPAYSQKAPYEFVSEIYERWDTERLSTLQQLQRFPMDVLSAVRLRLQPHANFDNLHDFLIHNQNSTEVQQARQALGASAAPPWSITTVTGKLSDNFIPPQAIEIVREAPHTFRAIPPPQKSHITQRTVPSPDPDTVVMMRLTHGWVAEHGQQLRNEFRRAYYRVAADNFPLHIDRRWESTMADLVHTSLRSEISTLWEQVIIDLGRKQTFAYGSLQRLNQTLVDSLNAEHQSEAPIISPAGDVILYTIKLPPFRLKIPPPICTFVYVLSQGNTHSLQDELLDTITENMPEENFCFVVNIVGRADIEKAFSPLREQGFLPLELTESDIKHIVSAPKPSNALSDIVISRVNLTAISPFYTRAPVPDHMFFGREREIADVRSKLVTHSVVLIGGRRIGKTSTLQKINRALRISDSLMMPFYLDCSNVLLHRHFFRRIQRAWQVEVPNANPDPIEFEDVVEFLRRRHPGRTPIFLLDEVDRLLKTDQEGEFDEPLFRTFRSLSNEKRCQFVFSGEKQLLHAINNPYSVLFNFPKKVKLSPLSMAVVHRLVTEPFEMLNIWLEDSQALIQQIYEISAGHPNIVQTICHALVEVIDKDKQANLLTKKHLGTVLDWHHVQLDIVQTIWGQMDDYARLLTLLWAEGKAEMSTQEMLETLQRVGVRNIQTQHIQEVVVPDLELYNIVQQRGQNYVLIPRLFPTILDEMTNKEMEIRAILEK